MGREQAYFNLMLGLHTKEVLSEAYLQAFWHLKCSRNGEILLHVLLLDSQTQSNRLPPGHDSRVPRRPWEGLGGHNLPPKGSDVQFSNSPLPHPLLHIICIVLVHLPTPQASLTHLSSAPALLPATPPMQFVSLTPYPSHQLTRPHPGVSPSRSLRCWRQGAESSCGS